MGKSAMLGSLEDTLAMSRAIPGVQPCLDFAHLHARPGDGSMNTYDEWSRVLEAYGEALGGEACESPAMEEDALVLQRSWSEVCEAGH
jgi:deoxyribonuclease-4